MDALVYEQSPLADILDAEVIPLERPTSTPPIPVHYAPRGLPRIREHFRALRRQAIFRQNASVDQFIENFRYTIIASQLLAEDAKSHSDVEWSQPMTTISFSLKGAYLTAAFSFSFAWVLSWIRKRWGSIGVSSWLEIFLFIAVVVSLFTSVSYTMARQYLKFAQRSAIAAVSKLVAVLHNYDATAVAVLRYVQEVEVVARGYELNHPLPPVTRLEQRCRSLRCRELRTCLMNSLVSGISQFAYFHEQVQPLVDAREVDTYHQIYDLRPEDLTQAVHHSDNFSEEDQRSLMHLRRLFELHAMARKLPLADLLAIKTTRSWSEASRWWRVTHVLQSITDDKVQSLRNLQDVYRHQVEPFDDGGRTVEGELVASPVDHSLGTPQRQSSRTQMRRFDTIVNAIRTLNAKASLARDEITSLIAMDNGEPDVSSSLIRHYDILGSELRNVLMDWERGRNIMRLNPDSDAKDSRPSSGIQSPISPSPSLGGLTVVDGGPAEALKLLNGDDEGSGPEHSNLGTEVFEAVARPGKRLSLALSREEKIAKLQEDRRKRATLQEQADTTTNMLRELQMVIKHRPTPSRGGSRVTSI